MNTDTYQRVEQRLTEIESEMKQIGYWQESALPAEAYDFQLAFAMDTMAYSQWLQFVFIPRVRSILESHGEFPASSRCECHRFPIRIRDTRSYGPIRTGSG